MNPAALRDPVDIRIVVHFPIKILVVINATKFPRVTFSICMYISTNNMNSGVVKTRFVKFIVFPSLHFVYICCKWHVVSLVADVRDMSQWVVRQVGASCAWWPGRDVEWWARAHTWLSGWPVHGRGRVEYAAPRTAFNINRSFLKYYLGDNQRDNRMEIWNVNVDGALDLFALRSRHLRRFGIPQKHILPMLYLRIQWCLKNEIVA